VCKTRTRNSLHPSAKSVLPSQERLPEERRLVQRVPDANEPLVAEVVVVVHETSDSREEG
jgi:hypothetical protein